MLQEMESMKADMMTLVTQLRDAEEKNHQLLAYSNSRAGHKNMAALAVASPVRNAAPDPALEKAVVDLQKALRVRDEKIKGYREIIIKLKDQFVKSEEDHARVAAAAAKGPGGGGVTMGAEEMKELKSQVRNKTMRFHCVCVRGLSLPLQTLTTTQSIDRTQLIAFGWISH